MNIITVHEKRCYEFEREQEEGCRKARMEEMEERNVTFYYLKSYCIYFFWGWLPQQASGSQKIGVGSVSPHGFQGPNSGCSTLQQMPLHTESFHQTPK